MQTSSNAQHFFETDASQEKRERRAAKSTNKYGNPVALKSKVLAVIADPTSASHVFIAESAGSARRVNIDDANAATAAYRGPTTPVTSLALGSTSTSCTLFAGCWDKTVWSWDLATRVVGRRYVGHGDFVKAVVCGQLGGQAVLISGGADKKIIVWDVATGRRLHTLQDKTGGPAMMAVQDLAIDPVATTADELWLVSASSDPHIRRIWRIRPDGWEQVEDAAETAETVANTAAAAAAGPRRTLLAHETTVYKLLFEDFADGDGQDIDLWTCSADGTTKCLSRIHGFADGSDTLAHGDHVRAVAVTDAWVVTAGRDEDVQFWDRATGRRYATLAGHFDEITGITVLADRRRLCSASLDGTLRTWPLDRAGLDDLVRRQEEDLKDDASPAAEEAAAEKTEDGLTVEEEAELAALMEDD
ncbi:WD repeat protein [Grosmannia clavigera kw1407]|uniref:WD repeat protein n=1 Tax=Grosmannia clavigera (strain kw1407 / UAMH 11150) TaxID=655863 RepID=F0XA40_GROCL|nr:WD repeat protein [Grosmannia clavigera kw1407]EFX05602.1 WD repeat protein [Grosmannia clavigera kw1407]